MERVLTTECCGSQWPMLMVRGDAAFATACGSAWETGPMSPDASDHLAARTTVMLTDTSDGGTFALWTPNENDR